MVIGLPELENKLMAMGASSQQCKSKVIPMMLTLFHDKDNAEMLHREWQNMVKAAQDKENEYIIASAECKSATAKLLKKEQALNDEKEELEKMRGSLLACKTQVARDNIKLAALFKQEAQPYNEYQRTEYIKGFGAILARNGEGEKQ